MHFGGQGGLGGGPLLAVFILFKLAKSYKLLRTFWEGCQGLPDIFKLF